MLPLGAAGANCVIMYDMYLKRFNPNQLPPGIPSREQLPWCPIRASVLYWPSPRLSYSPRGRRGERGRSERAPSLLLAPVAPCSRANGTPFSCATLTADTPLSVFCRSYETCEAGCGIGCVLLNSNVKRIARRNSSVLVCCNTHALAILQEAKAVGLNGGLVHENCSRGVGQGRKCGRVFLAPTC